MEALQAWRLDLTSIAEGLALGIDLFGPYAAWLWMFPVVWAVTAISLWLYVRHQQRRSDRAFLAYASRNLPLLRRIAEHRAVEVASSRTYDHDRF